MKITFRPEFDSSMYDTSIIDKLFVYQEEINKKAQNDLILSNTQTGLTFVFRFFKFNDEDFFKPVRQYQRREDEIFISIEITEAMLIQEKSMQQIFDDNVRNGIEILKSPIVLI